MLLQQNAEYRADGNHLYKRQKDGSFLYVYQDVNCRGLNQLLAAYTRRCEADLLDGYSGAYDDFK